MIKLSRCIDTIFIICLVLSFIEVLQTGLQIKTVKVVHPVYAAKPSISGKTDKPDHGQDNADPSHSVGPVAVDRPPAPNTVRATA